MQQQKSKADIVQRLLDKRYITAEEAVTLLSNESKSTSFPYPAFPRWTNPYMESPHTIPSPWFYSQLLNENKKDDEKI
jgi:hypothetical protein